MRTYLHRKSSKMWRAITKLNKIINCGYLLHHQCVGLVFILLAQNLITLAQISVSTCGPNFPNECTCGKEMYEGQLQYLVNCTKAGLRNTSVLEHMPQDVEILIFTGNYITELPWNVFGSINDYRNLKIVDMSSNHIREIRGKSYHRVQNVERLILNHNNLSISAESNDEVNHHHPRVFSNFINLKSLHLTDAFDDHSSPRLSQDLHDIFMNSQLVKLEILHLEQNEITHFGDRQVFCSLPSLRDLHLGDNLLNEINFEVKCLKNLRFLDLERNRFEFVKTHDMILLNELETRSDRTTNLMVDFNLNPFKCNCKLAPFYIWARKWTNVTVRKEENLMCYRNEVALPIMKMDMNKDCNSITLAAITMFETAATQYNSTELKNILMGTQTSSHTATLIFLLVVLSIILLFLIVALIYISRDKIHKLLTPVLDNAAKKVHYTSINDEDCPEVHV